jgi:hypothetical protein
MRSSVSVRAEQAQKSTPASEMATMTLPHFRVGTYSITF